MKYRNIDQYTLYMLILAPNKAHIGLDDTVYAEGTPYYNKNSTINTDEEYGITKREIAVRVDDFTRRGKQHAITLLK